jgi:hypothetical protein
MIDPQGIMEGKEAKRANMETSEVGGEGGLRWPGHVIRKDTDDLVGKLQNFEVEGKRC